MTQSVTQAVKPPRWTYETILAKYLARGVHPLSAKAQADQWQETHDQKRRRRERDLARAKSARRAAER